MLFWVFAGFLGGLTEPLLKAVAPVEWVAANARDTGHIARFVILVAAIIVTVRWYRGHRHRSAISAKRTTGGGTA